MGVLTAVPLSLDTATGKPLSAVVPQRATGSSGSPRLEVTNVSKRYGSHVALGSVSLAVRPGEFVALVGPSGSGKSTLLRIIAGFETPDGGMVCIDGADVTATDPARRPTSMVFQRLALFPHKTVAENIAFPLKVRGRPEAEVRERVAELIRLTRLRAEYLGRRPEQLSGGEQQRVALARAIACEPGILLLDEPLSALDFRLRKDLQAELKRLHRALGMTFLHVTHDLEEAMVLADRIAVMRGGAIFQQGSPEEIYYQPRSRFVAGFIGETNLLPVTLASRGGALGPSAPFLRAAPMLLDRERLAPGLGAGPAVLMVRPEFVRLLAPHESAEFELDATIEESFHKGSVIQFRARTAQGGHRAVLEMPGARVAPAAVGEAVRLGWRGSDCYAFADDEASDE